MPYQTPKTNWSIVDGVTDTDLNRIEGNTQYLADNLSSFGVGGGVANAYTATMTPAKTSLYAGMLIRIPIMVDNTGASTLAVDSLQAQPILNADGTAMAAGDLKSGGIYTFVYNGTSAFILQGKGGVSATDKQSLIDINNAADANNSSNKTSIVNGLNAVSTMSALGLTASSIWSDIINAIPNVNTGKRWQAGNYTFPSYGTAGATHTVSGLPFTPNLIYVYDTVGSFPNGGFAVYLGNTFGSPVHSNGGNNGIAYDAYNIQNVVNGAFDIKASAYSGTTTNRQLYWIAIA